MTCWTSRASDRILGFTSLMREGLSGPLTPEQQRQLGFVHGSGEHLLALINDLLDLSRIRSDPRLHQPDARGPVGTAHARAAAPARLRARLGRAPAGADQ